MFKLVVLSVLVAAANAGIFGHHETIAVAPIHHGHQASSYQNHNSVSVHPVPVAVAHHDHQAHIAVAHAPVAVAHHVAPVAVAHHVAPIAVAHHSIHDGGLFGHDDFGGHDFHHHHHY